MKFGTNEGNDSIDHEKIFNLINHWVLIRFLEWNK